MEDVRTTDIDTLDKILRGRNEKMNPFTKYLTRPPFSMRVKPMRLEMMVCVPDTGQAR